MKFEMPEQLPATVAELNELSDKAQAQINVIQARHKAGDELSPQDVDDLRELLGHVDTISAAAATAKAEEQAHRESVDELLARAAKTTDKVEADEANDESGDDAADEGADGAESDVEGAEAAPEVDADAGKELVTAKAKKGATFADKIKGTEPPKDDTGPGWEMVPGAPGFRSGKVGFKELGLAIDSVKVGRVARSNRPPQGGFSAQALAQLRRGDAPIVEDSHALVAAIEAATDERNLPNGSLIAAGGWCAPSETLYDFCDVPNATDLISVPEINIARGGIRWPVEPDLTAIFDSFQFFFTEPELEATDGNGNPTAFKNCVEIPCPDTMEEIRLNAVGYCVNAGILQTQGWPELITWFMQTLTQEHLRAISRRTILDIVNGSGTPLAIAANLQVGATSSALNSLALQATNLRLNKGLARNTTIEGIAPSWFMEVLRADLAMGRDLNVKSVSDSQIMQWLTDRNIALQWVGDWQTRDASQPGNLSTLKWPGHVDVVLYPAGTWFRSLQNVIELGVLYPKEQLQVNRYTRFFTEDAIAVGKRCNHSIIVRVPLPVTGGYGGPVTITPPADTAIDSGGILAAVPQPGGPQDHTGANTLTVSGSAGTYVLTYDGKPTTPIAYNATATAIAAALVALADGYNVGDFTVTGTGPFAITTPGGVLTAAGTGGATATIS